MGKEDFKYAFSRDNVTYVQFSREVNCSLPLFVLIEGQLYTTRCKKLGLMACTFDLEDFLLPVGQLLVINLKLSTHDIVIVQSEIVSFEAQDKGYRAKFLKLSGEDKESIKLKTSEIEAFNKSR